MNKCIMVGRLTSDPDIRYSQEGACVARYRIAVGRTFKREGEPEADFFSCTMFGKTAERFEKLNVKKGTKLLLEGEIRNNNYIDRNGVKRYGDQLIISNFEFCESKGSQTAEAPNTGEDDDFVNLPDGMADEDLPWG